MNKKPTAREWAEWYLECLELYYSGCVDYTGNGYAIGEIKENTEFARHKFRMSLEGCNCHE